MKKTARTLTVCLLVAGSLCAQKQSDVSGKSKPSKPGESQWLYFDPHAIPGSKTAYKDLPTVLGLVPDETMKFIKSNTDELGITHNRYQLFYKGIKVEGNQFITHSRNGSVYMANGKACSGININVLPAVSPEKAIELAKKMISAEKYMWENENQEYTLKEEAKERNSPYYPVPELIITKNKTKEAFIKENACLAYKVKISTRIPYGSYFVYIDANTGEEIRQTNLHTGCISPPLANCTTLTNINTLYSGPQSINVEQSGSQYYLKNSCKGNGILTRLNSIYSAGDVYFTTPWPSNSTEEALAQTHWLVDKYYDFLLNTYNRKSIDDNNGALLTELNTSPLSHFYSEFVSATMTYPNHVIVYSGPTNFWCSPDIIGHEWTHGMSFETIDFDADGEHQALNESISDIMGVVFEKYITGSYNWTIGESVNGTGIRNLASPGTTLFPDTYYGTNYDMSGTPDEYNLGSVISHWFYLLSEGGTGSSDVPTNYPDPDFYTNFPQPYSYPYTLTGIGVDDAGKIVYGAYNYLISTSEIPDFKRATCAAANDIYGGCSQQTNEVQEAWKAVGVFTGGFELLPPCPGIKICVDVNNETCDSDGSISVTITGGTTPIPVALWDMSINNFSLHTFTGNTVYNITPGMYSVIVDDDPYCETFSDEFYVAGPMYYDYPTGVQYPATHASITDQNADGIIAIKGPAVIDANLTLTGKVLYFGDDTPVSGLPSSGMVIKPGKTLTLDGCSLKPACDMWQGIQVWGNPASGASLSTHGKLIMKNGTTIEQAHKGVALYRTTPLPSSTDDYGRGILNASTGCKFINNRIAVDFKANTLYDNYSFVNNCQFIFNAPLKEDVYNGEATEAFIRIDMVKSVFVRSCSFTNSQSGYNYDKSGIGIKLLDAGCSLSSNSTTGNIFNNLYRGIDAYAAGTSKSFSSNSSIFNGCGEAICVTGNSSASIAGNTFYIPDSYLNSPYSPFGIRAQSTNYSYNINNNTFTRCSSCTGTSFGTLSYTGGTNGNTIAGNTFNGLSLACLAQGNNGNAGGGLQYRCNTFINNSAAIGVGLIGGGSLAPQGAAGTPPYNSFPDACPGGVYKDIFSAFPIAYYESSANPNPVDAACINNSVSVITTTTSINCNGDGGPIDRNLADLDAITDEVSKKELIQELIVKSEEHNSTEEKAEVIRLLKKWNSPEAKKILVPVLIDNQQVSEASAVLLSIVPENKDDKDFIGAYEILIGLTTRHMHPAEMNSSQETVLHTIAHSGSDYAYVAQSLLVRAGKEEFDRIVELPSFLKEQMAAAIPMRPVEDVSVLTDNIPNPFSESTTLSCYLDKKTDKGFLVVSDVTGKELFRFDVHKGSNTFEIKSNDLPNGIYYYNLVANGHVIAGKKMVIIK